MKTYKPEMDAGYYWALVRGFNSANYEWREEWMVMEFDEWGRWDRDMVKRKRLDDMTTIVRTVGPIERPEVTE